MIIDYERAWTDLKAQVLSKNSHGQRDLLTRMAADRDRLPCCPKNSAAFDPGPPYSKSSARALREVTRHG